MPSSKKKWICWIVMPSLPQFYTICHKLSSKWFSNLHKIKSFFPGYVQPIYTIYLQIRLPFALTGLPLLCTSKFHTPLRTWFKFHITHKVSLTLQRPLLPQNRKHYFAYYILADVAPSIRRHSEATMCTFPSHEMNYMSPGLKSSCISDSTQRKTSLFQSNTQLQTFLCILSESTLHWMSMHNFGSVYPFHDVTTILHSSETPSNW